LLLPSSLKNAVAPAITIKRWYLPRWPRASPRLSLSAGDPRPRAPELGRLDEAQTELAIVLDTAPDNLAANRAMAEIFQQRAQMPEALAYYKKALQLAQYDPDLEHAVERIENVVSPTSRKS
jgi:tetratricopeptide (TPR) repeat protein